MGKYDDIGTVVEEGNLDAIDKVEENIELQLLLKRKLIRKLLELVNQVCNENNLTYFAMGNLLSYAITENKEFLEGETFLIGMLRKDYDVLFDKISLLAKKRSVIVKPFYTGGAANRKNSTLTAIGIQNNSSSNYRMLITLRVEPFDELPSNPQKREAFIQRMTMIGNYLRNKSFSVLRRFKKAYREKRPYNLMQMGKDAITFAGLKKERRRYHKELCMYISEREDTDVARLEFVAYPPHNKREIFPLKKTSIDGVELMLPNDSSRLRTSTKEERLCELEESFIETLKKIDKIASENNIQYVAMESLCVAARKHKDFNEETHFGRSGIGLLRKDYNRLISILKNSESELKLYDTYEEYPHVHLESLGVIDRKYIKANFQQDTRQLRLYPLDALPNDYETLRNHKKSILDSVDELAEIQLSEMGNNDEIHIKSSEEKYAELQELLCIFNDKEPTSEQLIAIVNNQIKVFLRKDVFPGKRSSFSDFEIWTAANEFIGHEEKDIEYTEYMAKKKTDILREIDEICMKEKISYFAISYLLIGATIYNDVMPASGGKGWSIGLLRSDFEKLKTYIFMHGEKHALQFNEYLDEYQKYHRLDCSISALGDSKSNIKINVLPFDKIPEDRYLQMGFIDDMDEHNRLFREYIRIGAGDMRERRVLNPEDFEKLESFNLARETAYIEERAQLFNDDNRTHLYGRIEFGKSKFIPEDELFPLQRVKFRDIEINCPGDYTVWQPMLNDELQRQVHAIQKADLILLKEFDRVCSELDLGYFICGGTMLGYMRHGGFIPWDDDVDCAMLREDYDLFIKKAGEVLGDRFFLQTRETDETIPYVFSKIRLNDTEYITNYSDSREYHQGICLDIFPFDYLPNDGRARGQLVRDVIKLRRAHNIAARLQYPIPTEEIEPRNEIEREYIENAKETLRKNWEVDLSKTQDEYIKKATSYNAFAERDQLKTVASFAPTYTYIELQDLLPYQRGKFEGVDVSIPRRPDVFLEMQYGDYMQLPPPHMQVSHRLIKWSTWEESSEDNKKNDRNI